MTADALLRIVADEVRVLREEVDELRAQVDILLGVRDVRRLLDLVEEIEGDRDDTP
ncbi:MAG: hypothetical protein M3P96_15485 [Actinomycetota bacterium]|nr:hypothetical protein [Actinomycetota bacterium]